MEDKEFLIKLGHKIRILRDECGFSQEKLAVLADTDRGHISNIETGKANTKILYLKNIAKSLGVEVTELFNFRI